MCNAAIPTAVQIRAVVSGDKIEVSWRDKRVVIIQSLSYSRDCVIYTYSISLLQVLDSDLESRECRHCREKREIDT